jgi:hypothetical protein
MRLMRGRRIVAATMSGLLLGLCSAAPAAALQPGVFINPGSPAGKEYAFPLSVLRAQGAGKPAPNPNSSEPPFGVGVTAAHAGAGGQGPGSSGAGRRRRPHAATGGGKSGSGGPGGGTTGGRAGSAAPAPLSAGAQASLARIAAPGSSLGPMILIVAIVLVAGLACGVGLRVLGRRS